MPYEVLSTRQIRPAEGQIVEYGVSFIALEPRHRDVIDLTDESRSLDDARRRILLDGDLFELVMPAKFDLPAEFFDLVD